MSKTKTKATNVSSMKYSTEEAAMRIAALGMADTFLKTRTWELFNTPYTVNNVEELAGLIVNWAKTGTGVMTQVAATQEKAQKLEKVTEKPKAIAYS